jgi:hypothetical protein
MYDMCAQGSPFGRATLELAIQAFGTSGGERFGAALFNALLGANPGVWYAACLQVALVGVSSRARPTALSALANAAVGSLPLRVVNDCLDQVPMPVLQTGRALLCVSLHVGYRML